MNKVVIVPKQVRITAGMRLNVGNYSNVNIQVEIEDTATTRSIEEKADQLYEIAEDQVVDKLTQFIERLEKEGLIN